MVVDRTLDDATADRHGDRGVGRLPGGRPDEATGLLQAAGLTVYPIDDAPGLVVTRTVAMLVNGAIDARHKGVASAADIDTAMRLGTNYPLGPLAWGDRWGLGHDRERARRAAGLVRRGPVPPVRLAAADRRRRRVTDMRGHA